MSAEIFPEMDSVDESSLTSSRNPLLCFLCNEPYKEPCILSCFHSFCSDCLRGRAVDSKMTCPLCGLLTNLKDGANLPPLDLLLKFMVESTTEERAQCANCDSTSSQMFFCNTCMQPLCSYCREETHKAKMFSSHDMVLLTKRAREVHKKCSLHEEPYIMFSSEKKIMLCINCFRDMRIESRGHCLDLETAYKQSYKKLDLRVQAFRELQNSVREGILLFRALLDEIKTNAEKERCAIDDLCQLLIEKINETKQLLLHKVDSQYEEKEETFRSQLASLCTLLPTLQVHLVVSSAFSGSANKFEFLDLAYVLMERLKSIVQKQHPLHPTQSGQIDTSHKTEFFKSMEPLLHVPVQRSALKSSTTTTNSVTSVTAATSTPNSPAIQKPTPTRRANGLNGAKVKFIDAKGSFAEHCREFENAHRDLMHRFDHMKTHCQELQRDMTMRRCLAKKDEVMQLSEKIELIQNQLDSHFTTLENKSPALEKHWEESLDRIHNEQDLYQAQLQDVMRLKNESQHLRMIISQLSSFVSSIAAVTERLAPKLGQHCQHAEQEQQMVSLLDEINAVQPDSKQRVDAIRDAEEERQTILSNRTNPLDDQLIKTKCLLRDPSLRDKKGERRRKAKDASTNSTTTNSESTITVASCLPDELYINSNEELTFTLSPTGATCSNSSANTNNILQANSNVQSNNKSNGNQNLDDCVRITTKGATVYNETKTMCTQQVDEKRPTRSNSSSSQENKKEDETPPADKQNGGRKLTRKESSSSISSTGSPVDKILSPSSSSSEIDAEARRNFLKDIENVKKIEPIVVVVNNSVDVSSSPALHAIVEQSTV